MHRHPAFLPVLPMLKYIYSLPCSQSETALLQRDSKLGLCQGGFDMRRHVIGSLGGMSVRAVLRRDAVEKILQIMAHVRVGIFLDGERGRGVLDEQSEQAFLHPLFVAPVHHCCRDFIKPRAICVGAQIVSYLPHPPRVAN